MIAQEVNAWNTAMEMIKEGLRPPVVHAATGLYLNRLRSLYRALHRKAPVQGRVSEYAYNRLKNRSQVIEGTVYYQVYHRLGGAEVFRVLDPALVITAYRPYKVSSADSINVTTAWYIARDLRENPISTIRTPIR
jgi:hypothetical protein